MFRIVLSFFLKALKANLNYRQHLYIGSGILARNRADAHTVALFQDPFGKAEVLPISFLNFK